MYPACVVVFRLSPCTKEDIKLRMPALVLRTEPLLPEKTMLHMIWIDARPSLDCQARRRQADARCGVVVLRR
jgi:hypothetical protein